MSFVCCCCSFSTVFPTLFGTKKKKRHIHVVSASHHGFLCCADPTELGYIKASGISENLPLNISRKSDAIQDSACHQIGREIITKARVTELIFVMVRVLAASTRKTVTPVRFVIFVHQQW